VWIEVVAGYRLPQPPNTPPAIYRLMQECWCYNSALRPTLVTIHRTLARLLNKLDDRLHLGSPASAGISSNYALEDSSIPTYLELTSEPSNGGLLVDQVKRTPPNSYVTLEDILSPKGNSLVEQIDLPQIHKLKLDIDLSHAKLSPGNSETNYTYAFKPNVGSPVTNSHKTEDQLQQVVDVTLLKRSIWV
jgi:hypothetical protein